MRELARQGIERLAGRLVDVHVQEARQRICAAVRVVRGGLLAGRAGLLGERHGADARRRVPDSAVAHREAVDRGSLDDRRRAGLLLHLVLVVTVLQDVLLEEPVRSGSRVPAVEADRLRRPLAREAELAPCLHVLGVPAAPRLGERGVHLGEREALDGIVLVHEHRERVDGGANRRSACSRTSSRSRRSRCPSSPGTSGRAERSQRSARAAPSRSPCPRSGSWRWGRTSGTARPTGS